MQFEVKSPTFPESISVGFLAHWHKNAGDEIERDEPLADIETEKTTIEIVAPVSGTVIELLKESGDEIGDEERIATIEASAADVRGASTEVARPVERASSPPQPAPSQLSSPAARKLAEEEGIDLSEVKGSGREGRITKEDVRRTTESARSKTSETSKQEMKPPPGRMVDEGDRVERRVPMTRLRQTIAKRLVEAQRNAAMLTTFNEADMSPIMAMRRQYQEEFKKRHNGTKLGFMSFFVRASVEALKRFPSVNASIDGTDVVYHGFFDIGVAVSTDRGLVVPVVRNADALGLAQIEDQISDYGSKARENRLAIEEMQGGTFTISNGGVFGSLLSTPILNPPQSAILGMHKIQDRPVVVDGEIVIRPMMYLALSYDHRLIDGQEAVSFLVALKGMIEDPARVLLEL